jgi:hypothetical protein
VFDVNNLPDHRLGIILTPQTKRSIPLGSSGLWFDGSAIYYVVADGTQAFNLDTLRFSASGSAGSRFQGSPDPA